MQHRRFDIQRHRLAAVTLLVLCVAVPGLIGVAQTELGATAVLAWTALAVAVPLPFIDDITQPSEPRAFWTSVILAGALLAIAHSVLLVVAFRVFPHLERVWTS